MNNDISVIHIRKVIFYLVNKKKTKDGSSHVPETYRYTNSMLCFNSYDSYCDHAVVLTMEPRNIIAIRKHTNGT